MNHYDQSKALSELGKQQLGQAPSTTILNAVVSCGLIDLDESMTAYRKARYKIEVICDEIEKIKAKGPVSWSRSDPDKRRTDSLNRRLENLLKVSPLGDTTLLKLLFSFIAEVKKAIVCSRGYVAERQGVNFFQLPFLESFILPVLEGRLSRKWRTDKIWNVVDKQITQRVEPEYLQKKIRSPEAVFARLKYQLNRERLQILIAGVCESEKCDAKQLKSLIAQLREKAESWPLEYR